MKTVISTPDGYRIEISTRRGPNKRRPDKPRATRKSRPKFKQLTLW
jgi:hypothetical protein